MVYLFEKYCVPLHSGRKMAYSDNMVAVNQIPGEVIMAEPHSRLTVSMHRNICTVSDDLERLNPTEQRDLNDQFIALIPVHFSEFSKDANHSAGNGGTIQTWSNGAKSGSASRAAAYIVRFTSEGATSMGLGTPNAPRY